MSAPELDEDLMDTLRAELLKVFEDCTSGIAVASLACDILRAIDLAGYDIVKREEPSSVEAGDTP